MKKILFTLLTIFAISYSPLAISCTHASPQPKEIIAEATYQAGDSDTPVAAQEAALLLAKRNALEQCGTLVTSSTTIQNYIIKDDTVRSLAAGVMEVTILDKKRTPVGNGTEFYVKIRAIVYPDKLNVALKLLANGLTPSPLPQRIVRKTYNDTATQLLISAVDHGDLDQVKQAFAMNANPNITRGGYTAPFITAVLNERADIVKCFIDNGADLNLDIYDIGTGEATPLWAAVAKNNLSLTALLINAGASQNKLFRDGTNVLFMAVERNNINIAKYLLDCGVNINKADNHGITPLYFACKDGHYEMVQLLLGYGANPNAFTNDGSKPIDAAIHSGNKDLINLLLSYK
ncbi:MAG: hypothetical protein H6Q69_957 [Firmicutes bacterium]|nr:hypothetical protein [Bacillota bacterium]